MHQVGRIARCCAQGARGWDRGLARAVFAGCARSSSSSSSSSSAVHKLTPKRLRDLLEAELVHFSHALKPHGLTLQEILAMRNPEQLRAFLLEELPIRFARRVQTIETLDHWKDFPHMRVIRNVYADAFQKLRGIDSHEPERFRQVLQDIQRNNSNMPERIVRGTRAMKKKLNLSDETVNAFLDDFLKQRIGTEILSSQYLAITRPGRPTSVIDPECDPVAIIRAAARDASQLCRHHYQFAPPVDITQIGEVSFPFLARYLLYIMLEILKNSMRAVSDRHGRDAVEDHPVRVVVCSDDESVVIRVSDDGGGIPLTEINKIWSYMYTTAKPQGEDPDELGSGFYDDDVAPLAGFGCGLPLSRNYVRYVGGSLRLHSNPRSGCDVYLYLDRIGNEPEQVESALMDNLPSRGALRGQL